MELYPKEEYEVDYWKKRKYSFTMSSGCKDKKKQHIKKRIFKIRLFRLVGLCEQGWDWRGEQQAFKG